MKKNKIRIDRIPVIPAHIAKEYAGRTAAIIGNRVVAGGNNTQEAIKNAQKRFPKVKEWQIGIMSIPPKDGVWVV
jgi:hypothetical protein